MSTRRPSSLPTLFWLSQNNERYLAPPLYGGCTEEPVVGVAIYYRPRDRKWPGADGEVTLPSGCCPHIAVIDISDSGLCRIATDHRAQGAPVLRPYREPSTHYLSMNLLSGL